MYAPWCGHCKALEPVYKKLAKRFAKVDSVVIAKMDGTENEHADVEVKGFPTILFYPAGDSKKAVSFEGGDRSLKVGFVRSSWFVYKHFHVHMCGQVQQRDYVSSRTAVVWSCTQLDWTSAVWTDTVLLYAAHQHPSV